MYMLLLPHKARPAKTRKRNSDSTSATNCLQDRQQSYLWRQDSVVRVVDNWSQGSCG